MPLISYARGQGQSSDSLVPREEAAKCMGEPEMTKDLQPHDYSHYWLSAKRSQPGRRDQNPYNELYIVREMFTRDKCRKLARPREAVKKPTGYMAVPGKAHRDGDI